jgi:hypothetical protein
VLGQAAGFALLAAVSPTTLLVMAVLLLTAATVWLPLLTYLAYPEATTRRLRTANEWLRLRGRVLVRPPVTGLAPPASRDLRHVGMP